MKVIGLAVAGTVLVFASGAHAYPGGVPTYQTDAAPFCASCHASLDAEALAGAGERATKELVENKHLAMIQAGKEGYAELSAEERAQLVEHIRALDAASTVEMTALPRVKVGEQFTVTVDVAGGAGPVVAVALVDVPHRWHARPAPGAGWQVVSAPTIIGQDFKEQTEWLAKRPESAGRNLSFVNVKGIASDASKGEWGRAQVVWKLLAPGKPGVYPLAAAYWYGTEKGSPLGFTVDPIRGKMIRGGFTGHSGRVRFTPVQRIEVQ